MRANERGTGNLYGVTPECLTNNTEVHIRQVHMYMIHFCLFQVGPFINPVPA